MVRTRNGKNMKSKVDKKFHADWKLKYFERKKIKMKKNFLKQEGTQIKKWVVNFFVTQKDKIFNEGEWFSMEDVMRK